MLAPTTRSKALQRSPEIGGARPDWRVAALATWFGAGRLPGAPGTWGSLTALPLAAVAHWAGGWAAVAAVALAVFAVGVWAASAYVAQSGESDPPAVVVDEVAGQCLVLAAASPGVLDYALGFALFRLFDIWKPWPVSWVDRALKGGLGVMLDDALAGGYAAAVLLLLKSWGLP